MTPLLLFGARKGSLKVELWIVAGVILFFVTMPIISLAGLTDLSALSDAENTLYDGPRSTDNTYIFGYCTFWAAKRRAEIGKSIPNDWGDAHTWDDRARRDGYIVDHTPEVGAIMQTDVGELGHVAFVEEVYSDGGWRVSEMNYVGWNVVSGRKPSTTEAQKYTFIHSPSR